LHFQPISTNKENFDMVKSVTEFVCKRFVALFLAVSIIFVGFSSPAYAASSEDAFVSGMKNGAGMAVSGLALCAGTAVVAPPLAPVVCLGASAETILAGMGLRFLFGR
jgi:hypothetical protein